MVLSYLCVSWLSSSLAGATLSPVWRSGWAYSRAVSGDQPVNCAVSICLLCSLLGISVCARLPSGVQASCSPPVSPTSPPVSLGAHLPSAGSRTGGLICGLNRLLPREDFCLCNLPFPLGNPSGHRSSTDCFSFFPILFYEDLFFSALVVQESFCQFPVSFQQELYHM